MLSANICKLTSSLERAPWRGKLLRRASSTRYPSDSSYSPYLPTAAAVCDCEACVQLPNLWSYCSNKHRTPQPTRRKGPQVRKTEASHRQQVLSKLTPCWRTDCGLLLRVQRGALLGKQPPWNRSRRQTLLLPLAVLLLLF